MDKNTNGHKDSNALLQEELSQTKAELEQVKKELSDLEKKRLQAEKCNKDLRLEVEKLNCLLRLCQATNTSIGSTVDAAVQVDEQTIASDLAYEYAAHGGHSNEDAPATEDVATGDGSMSLWATPGDQMKDEEVEEGEVKEAVPTIAESLKDAAETAIHESGYVYDERTGLYFDHKSGYYYDPQNQLYYEPNSGTYYYYEPETMSYCFHSRIDLPGYYLNEPSQPQQGTGNMNVNMNRDMDMNRDMNMGMDRDMNMGMNRNMDMNRDMNMGMNRDMNMGMNRDMNMGMNRDMNTGMNRDMDCRDMNMPMDRGMNMDMNVGMNRGMDMNRLRDVPICMLRDMYMNNNPNQERRSEKKMSKKSRKSALGNKNISKVHVPNEDTYTNVKKQIKPERPFLITLTDYFNEPLPVLGPKLKQRRKKKPGKEEKNAADKSSSMNSKLNDEKNSQSSEKTDEKSNTISSKPALYVGTEEKKKASFDLDSRRVIFPIVDVDNEDRNVSGNKNKVQGIPVCKKRKISNCRKCNSSYCKCDKSRTKTEKFVNIKKKNTDTVISIGDVSKTATPVIGPSVELFMQYTQEIKPKQEHTSQYSLECKKGITEDELNLSMTKVEESRKVHDSVDILHSSSAVLHSESSGDVNCPPFDLVKDTAESMDVSGDLDSKFKTQTEGVCDSDDDLNQMEEGDEWLSELNEIITETFMQQETAETQDSEDFQTVEDNMETAAADPLEQKGRGVNACVSGLGRDGICEEKGQLFKNCQNEEIMNTGINDLTKNDDCIEDPETASEATAKPVKSSAVDACAIGLVGNDQAKVGNLLEKAQTIEQLDTKDVKVLTEQEAGVAHESGSKADRKSETGGELLEDSLEDSQLLKNTLANSEQSKRTTDIPLVDPTVSDSCVIPSVATGVNEQTFLHASVTGCDMPVMNEGLSESTKHLEEIVIPNQVTNGKQQTETVDVDKTLILNEDTNDRKQTVSGCVEEVVNLNEITTTGSDGVDEIVSLNEDTKDKEKTVSIDNTVNSSDGDEAEDDEGHHVSIDDLEDLFSLESEENEMEDGEISEADDEDMDDNDEDKTDKEDLEEVLQTEGPYEKANLYADNVYTEDNNMEDATHWPPCIRIMVTDSDKLSVGDLYIVTCTGATLGSEKNNTVIIPDSGVNKTHCSIVYHEEERTYIIQDCGSEKGTFLNDRRLGKAKQCSDWFRIQHKDTLAVGGTSLSLHIHSGTSTCNECEPGIMKAQQFKHTNTTAPVTHTKGDLEKLRRKELKQIKKKFGLENAAYVSDHVTNPNYKDKAADRRKTVGSDNPYQKDDPSASVHVAISTENKGHKLLAKMGWKEGDSLGKSSAGITEPINVGVRASKTAGLGSYGDMAHSMDHLHSVKHTAKWLKTRQRYQDIEKSASGQGSASAESEQGNKT